MVNSIWGSGIMNFGGRKFPIVDKAEVETHDGSVDIPVVDIPMMSPEEERRRPERDAMKRYKEIVGVEADSPAVALKWLLDYLGTTERKATA